MSVPVYIGLPKEIAARVRGWLAEEKIPAKSVVVVDAEDLIPGAEKLLATIEQFSFFKEGARQDENL